MLDFVALKEGITVRQAVIRISEWFGLTFETPVDSKTSGRAGTRGTPDNHVATAVGQAQAAPADQGVNKVLGFQLQNLDAAHPYLVQRGLTPETIAEFGLGFCANGSMKGRIVIPIHSLSGELLAYAGRWPGEAPVGTPKYKIPAGSKKSLELFNLHRAIQQPPDHPLVLVEGFFGCIRLWQLGIQRVVGVMGSTPQAACHWWLDRESRRRECPLSATRWSVFQVK